MAVSSSYRTRQRPPPVDGHWLLGLGLVLPLGSGACVEDPISNRAPVPFTVSDYYAPSGFMGDGSFAGLDAIVLTLDDDRCAMRPEDAQGSCYRFEYEPLPDGPGWGGVYWQSPPSNWGTEPGRPIAPGATRVTFWAASEPAGVPVTFSVGGLQGNDENGEPLAHQDTFRVEQTIILDPSLTSHAIELDDDLDYDEVLGGFGWTITASTIDGPVVLYLDHIRWER